MKQSYLLIIVALFATAGYSQCTPPAVPTATGPADPICGGTTATLTATADTGTLAWFTAATGGTAIATGTPFQTPSLSSTTSYWVEAQGEPILGTLQTGGGKTTHGNSGSAVNAASNPWGLVFNATQPFILNSVEVYLSSGIAGDIVVQLKDSNFNILETVTIAAPAGGTSSNPVPFTIPLNFDIPVGNGYRLVADTGPAMIRDFSSGVSYPYPIGSVGSITQGTINDSNSNSGLYYLFYNWSFTPYIPCASARQQVTVNVNTTAAPTASSQPFCGSSTVGGLQAVGTDLKWYSAASGGSELADDTALTTATYYVSQTLNGCESARTAVAVTVTPIPAAPPANAQSFCGSATVAQLTATGTNLNWYAGEDNNAPLAIGTPLETATYYVSQTINSCEGTRTAVAVTINDVPEAPDADAQVFCGSGIVGQLDAIGDNLQWYSGETGGIALTDDTALAEGTYYVSQTIGICESTRTAVTITINPLPDAPTADAMVFCNSGTVAGLEATGDNLQWYTTEAGGEALADDDAIASGMYYVSQSAGGCESTRTGVAVTLNVTPEPTGNALQDFIPGETLADLVIEGEMLNWYADADGMMPLDASTSLVHETSYWVSQTINGCEGPLMMVTVSQAMSVAGQSFSGLSYYPNPVSDKLMISNSLPITAITIYNLQGQKLQSTMVNATDATVYLSAFAAGAYIVHLSSGEATTTLKVVKQ